MKNLPIPLPHGMTRKQLKAAAHEMGRKRFSEYAKRYYRHLAKKHHPGRPGGSTEKMQRINAIKDRYK